jgi:biotin synthase-related radical SAM superfamily protein
MKKVRGKDVPNENQPSPESPEYLRMSLAAAMTLGLETGPILSQCQIVLHQPAAHLWCGVCRKMRLLRPFQKRAGQYGDKSFIRVTWPTHSLARSF